jgi:DNA-binding response OmpR family regulator
VCRTATLLIVDDEEPTLLAMMDYFTHYGFAVDGSRDFSEAKALLMAKPYAVLITDLQLAEPGDKSGFDLISFARNTRPDTRLILLTAHESPQVEAEARRLGADAFFWKPQPLSELGQTVCDLLPVGPTMCQRPSRT